MIKQRTTVMIAIMLMFSILSGFVTAEQTVAASANDDGRANGEATAENLIEMIEQFEADGNITSEPIARSLKNHVQGLAHYFNQGNYEKASNHIDGFIDLLEQLHAMDIVSETAKEQLGTYATSLKQNWTMTFDSNRVMATLKDLSVHIGPRVAGADGEKEAANYLKGRFEEYGYDVTLQEFPIRDQLRTKLTVNDDFAPALGTAVGAAETSEDGVTANVVAAGEGTEEEFPENTEGNIVLIERGNISFADKVKNAQQKGAVGVLIYDNAESLMPVRPSLGGEQIDIPVVGLMKADGEAILEKLQQNDDVQANLYVRTETELTSQNVVAVKKPENIENPEIVYITAHYDSVPFSPGANDDGTGTSAIVEIARILKDMPTDKEIRVIAFGAEEIGLVGSRYYVDNLSADEISRSAINFQLEMLAAKYEPGGYFAVNTVDGQPNIIWDYINNTFDKFEHDKDKLILFRRGQSDHVPFHEAGIIAACFNMGTASGGLEPEYHTSFDTFDNVSQERIDYAGTIITDAILQYFTEHGSLGGEALDDAS